MSNPHLDDMKRTGAAKGRAMGVTNEFLPDRAARISGKPASATAATPPSLTDPQHPENKQGPKYDNLTSGWVCAEGERGEAKPGFDHSKKSG